VEIDFTASRGKAELLGMLWSPFAAGFFELISRLVLDETMIALRPSFALVGPLAIVGLLYVHEPLHPFAHRVFGGVQARRNLVTTHALAPEWTRAYRLAVALPMVLAIPRP
jgi:hypothetical protein